MSDHEPQITVIGPDTRFKGEMSFDRTARVLGQFEGRVSTSGELQIGDSAHCKAAIEAGTVIVDGFVEGDIVASERVQLNGSARVNGDVVADKLIVSEGASFSGHCRVGPEAVAQAGSPKPKASTTAASSTSEPKPEPSSGPRFDWVGQPVTTDAKSRTGWGPSTGDSRASRPSEGAA